MPHKGKRIGSRKQSRSTRQRKTTRARANATTRSLNTATRGRRRTDALSKSRLRRSKRVGRR